MSKEVKSEKKLTPMMKQYYEIKSEYQDCILFFRLGDFYEMFGEDAEVASEILDITLTSRSKGENALPMCGIPYHSAESYIAKLNQKGKRVAVCEQVSNPKEKGIVERAVKKVLTPSTNTSDLNLEAKENQFLLVIDGEIDNLKSCIVDVSTGEILLRDLSSLEDIENVLQTYRVKEIVIDKTLYEKPSMYSFTQKLNGILITSYVADSIAKSKVGDKWNKKLKVFEDEKMIGPCFLAGAYLMDVIGFEIEAIQKITSISNSDEYFELDRSSVFNLEIFYTLMEGTRENSLIEHIDYTKTSMGGRKLRSWVVRPLKSIQKIVERQNLVAGMIALEGKVKTKFQETINSIYDIDRLLSRVNNASASPKDLIALKVSLCESRNLKEINFDCDEIKCLAEKIPNIDDILIVLDKLKTEDVKISTREGGIFSKGIDTELDELRELLFNGKNYLLKIQQTEAEKNGISTLKLGYNKVFGYYLEVSKGKTDLVPDYFIRKQTLTNSERYITPELKEYEEKVLSAQDKVREIEFNMFVDLLDELKQFSGKIMKVSEVVSELDCVNSLGALAVDKNYCRPVMTTQKSINIVNGRHPVIENIVGGHAFIANSINFDEESNVQIITGPNMGGKSTYLRQTALICLMAQIGSYVPADKAEIGVVDQIFSRVGAADNLSKGQSTFMVEMTETAYILTQATKKSLIIMDEVGRGTSTSDGLSLAKGIVDYLNLNTQARTLFATHYHEIIQYGELNDGIKNFSISVTHDENGKPIFLHKIVEGGINKSYGIEVAESAGVPMEVIENSKKYLEQLNNQGRTHTGLDEYAQTSLFQGDDPRLIELRKKANNININETTPLQSMATLDELVKFIKDA